MNKDKTLLLILTAFCSFLPAFLYAQVDTAWVRKYNGPVNGLDWASVVQVDRQGNVFIAGESDGSGTSVDGLLIKYNSAGVQQWVKRYNATNNLYDAFYHLKLDTLGNIYVAGVTSASDSTFNFLVIKYNANGDTVWKRTYNGTGNYDDLVEGLAIDGLGNIYVTGESYGASTGFDIVTIKYNSAGSSQWIIRYNGTVNDNDIPGWGISVDASNNVYITGGTRNVADNDDVVVIKYNTNGIQQWIRTYNSPYNGYDWGNGLTIDNSGNVYIAVESEGSGTGLDFVVIKYNTSGDLQWTTRYNGVASDEDIPTAIVVNNQSEVYCAGWTAVTTSNYDMLTIKYSVIGDTLWTRRYGSSANMEDKVWSMALDNPGNIYVAGTTTGSSSGTDYAVIKYSSSGIQRWMRSYSSSGNNFDQISYITVDNSANIYVTGGCWGSSTDFDIATIKYTQTQGVTEERLSSINDQYSFEIFPNPAKSFLTVRFPTVISDRQIQIFDVTGTLIKNEEFKKLKTQEVKIALDGIKNGVYFIQAGNNFVKGKVVIAR